MKTVQYLCIALLLALITGLAMATPPKQILPGDDWAAEASAAQSDGTPIMLVFTADNCSYCERLKRELLKPLLQTGQLSGSVRLREFNIDHGGKIVDFDGERIRSRIFVDRYKIFATPTVLLLDQQGNALAPPIVGFNNAENYRVLLTQAIEQARPLLASSTVHRAGVE